MPWLTCEFAGFVHVGWGNPAGCQSTSGLLGGKHPLQRHAHQVGWVLAFRCVGVVKNALRVYLDMIPLMGRTAALHSR